MITETETAFLAVVRAFLTEEKAALEELAALTEKQWNHLFVLAAQHSLLSAVYDVVGKTPEFAELPDELRRQVKTQAMQSILQQVSRTALFLTDEKELEQLGVPTEVFTSITMPQVAQPFTRKDALRAMDEGKIAVFGGGTGNPIFSTDTASALRALEIGADAMFKATMVDGVYDKDPHKYPDAVKYDTLTFTRVLDERLAVMDSTAATLCRDNGLPIVVFDLNEPANIARALQGENVGTIVRE